MKSIKEFAADIHQNAVAHGWWDKGERNVCELLMPEWCDVIIRRWEKLTGEKAVKIKA